MTINVRRYTTAQALARLGSTVAADISQSVYKVQVYRQKNTSTTFSKWVFRNFKGVHSSNPLQKYLEYTKRPISSQKYRIPTLYCLTQTYSDSLQDKPWITCFTPEAKWHREY